MKKRLFALTLAAVLVLLCAACTPAAEVMPTPTPDVEEETAEWERLDAYYDTVINVRDHAPILIGQVQDAVEFKSFESSGNTLSGLMSDETGITTAFADIEITKVGTGTNTVIVPRDIHSTGNVYAIAPNGQYTVFAFDGGMVCVDGQGTAKTVTPSTYQGKTYEQLRDETIELYDNILFWNGQISISPDSKYAAYISNKEDMTNSWDLFVLDMTTGEEKLIGNDAQMRYGVNRWLDNTHILCDKSYDGKSVTVIVDTEGNEIIPDFAADHPAILGARDGVIAYGSGGEDNTIRFAKFNGTETLEEIGRIDLDGIFRVRPGIDPFSPDGTRFACILVPDHAPSRRDVVVYDLQTGVCRGNETAPYGTKDQICVLEFHWLDDDTLLTSIQDNGTDALSSWLYHIGKDAIK